MGIPGLAVAWVAAFIPASPTAATAAATAKPKSAAGQTFAVRVAHALDGAGGVIDDAVIVVRDGNIQSISKGPAPEGCPLVEFAGAFACPAFIDPQAELGMVADALEPADALTPQVEARDALNARHSAFLDAARSGVAVVGLTPNSGNVIGGRLAITATCGDADTAEFLAHGPLRMAFVPETFDRNRKPTSRMGAAYLSREHFKSAGPERAGVIVEARSADEIRVALDVVESAGKITLLNPTEAWRVGDLVKEAGSFAIFRGLDASTPPRVMEVARDFASRSACAFSAGGDGESLRFAAALAVRSGMDPQQALAALTQAPAQILGIADRAGTLEAGKRADLLITSGNPLDLSSKVLAVFVGGRRVAMPEEAR